MSSKEEDELVNMMRKTVLQRRYPLLLVLDLNGTLICRITKNKHHLFHNVDLPKPDHSINRAKVFERPHVRPFLEYIFNNFFVATWTSAMKTTSDGLLNALLTEKQRNELVFSWDRDHCCDISGAENDYEAKKDLNRAWQYAFSKHKKNSKLEPSPISKESNVFDEKANKFAFSTRNTILIDDSPGKASHTPENCMVLPTYTLLNKEYWNDRALLEIMKYLEIIKEKYPMLDDIPTPLEESDDINKTNRLVPKTPLPTDFDIQKILRENPCFPTKA